jgi:hypothetical protein
MNKLIGIAGKKGAGKDTAASYIIAQNPRRYRKYSFATPLKEACKAMFGWTDYELEDRVAKETVDPFWGFSPRTAMQLLGTNFGRNMLRADIWLKAAEKQFNMNNTLYNTGTLITDVRFENEAEWIRNNSGIIIHVVEPGVSSKIDEHESEVGIDIYPVDFLLTNDKTAGLISLHQKLDLLMKRM